MDLVTLTGLVDIFREQDLQEAERVMDVVEMIHSLTTLYEKLEEDRSILVNIPLCIDMCLNWLLNVYDRWVIWWTWSLTSHLKKKKNLNNLSI